MKDFRDSSIVYSELYEKISEPDIDRRKVLDLVTEYGSSILEEFAKTASEIILNKGMDK